MLATHTLQVILSDQRMPEMSGNDFLLSVREQTPDTIRILLSGYSDLDSITGAIYRLLSKPRDDEPLRELMREAFRHLQR